MHSNIFCILLDVRLQMMMRNIMLYWFCNHSSLSISCTLVHSEACETGKNINEFNLNIDVIWCILLIYLISFHDICTGLIMINVMLYWFHHHSSLTFSFTHTRLIRILRVKMDSWILNTYLPRCILIYRTYALPGRLAMRNIMPNGFRNYPSSLLIWFFNEF